MEALTIKEIRNLIKKELTDEEYEIKELLELYMVLASSKTIEKNTPSNI